MLVTHTALKQMRYCTRHQMHKQAASAEAAQSWIGSFVVQVIASQTFSKAGDVYSFGIILWELLTWKVPWEEHNLFQVCCSPSHQPLDL